MSGPTLDHVQIAAPPGCEPAARHFFGDLLGLQELPKPAPLIARGGCWFALGNRQLHGPRPGTRSGCPRGRRSKSGGPSERRL
jgi:hypothetical protein